MVGDNFYGYEITVDWKNSNCGKIARAKKGGKTYFIKQYQTPVEPQNNGALDARTIAANKKMFDQFYSRRKRVNTKLRTIAGEGGNIVIPREEFIHDHHYIEVSEFVDGAVGDDDLERVLNGLSIEVKKLLMLTAAGALASVHRLGIIHSDLKLKNVLLAKNTSNNYVAKLIDFDGSYFTDDIPDEVVGDINYFSPELANFSAVEDEDEKKELHSTLTDKSDIFSLGLIFHYYLTGEMPQAKTLTERLQKRKDKGKSIYTWLIVSNGCELVLSRKITSLKYLSLINDMLSLNPEDRPSASEVLVRLKATEETGVIEEPWAEHKIVILENRLKDAGYVTIKKISRSGVNKYSLMTSAGKKSEKTREQLVSEGIARVAREKKYCEPWSDHKITFVEEKLRSRGYVAAEQHEYMGVKGYDMYTEDDSCRFFPVSTLISLGFAKRTDGGSGSAGGSTSAPRVITESFCEPWPQHAIVFDKDKIKSRGFVRSAQKELNGVKGYMFTKADGTEQFINETMVLFFKMAAKK